MKYSIFINVILIRHTSQKKLGVSVRTVQRINKRFDEFDVIKIERRLDEESKKSMNFYILPG